MGLGEKLWWGYKYFFRPVEQAEARQGIEEFFRDQDLSFKYDDGFEETAALTLSAGGDLLASHHIRPETTAHLWDDVRSFYFDADNRLCQSRDALRHLRAAELRAEGHPQAPPLNNSPEIFPRIVEGGHGVNFSLPPTITASIRAKGGLVETLDFLTPRAIPTWHGPLPGGEGQGRHGGEEGVKLAFLSYTFSLNGKTFRRARATLPTMCASIGRTPISLPSSGDIAAAKAAGSRRHRRLPALEPRVRVVPRYGTSSTWATGSSRAASTSSSATIPHGVQPIESYAFTDPVTGAAKRGLILYALGDLLSCHAGVPNSRLGNLVRIGISKGKAGGKECVRITSLEIAPTYLYAKLKDDVCEDFRILDFRKLAGELHAGVNAHGLDAAAQKEVGRLEGLMGKVLHGRIEGLGWGRSAIEDPAPDHRHADIEVPIQDRDVRVLAFFQAPLCLVYSRYAGRREAGHADGRLQWIPQAADRRYPLRDGQGAAHDGVVLCLVDALKTRDAFLYHDADFSVGSTRRRGGRLT